VAWHRVFSASVGSLIPDPDSNSDFLLQNLNLLYDFDPDDVNVRAEIDSAWVLAMEPSKNSRAHDTSAIGDLGPPLVLAG